MAAELLYGAERSGRKEANLVKVEATLKTIEVLPVTLETARRFATLKSLLTSIGRTKADMDLHIAATAIHAGAMLVTNDGALLDGSIPELSVENWV